jgi:hypothetical protein
MSLTVATARGLVQKNLRSNGFDTTLYSATDLDYAISEAGEELAREAVLLRTVGTASLASGAQSIATADLPTGLRPDRLMNVYLIGNNVEVMIGTGVLPPYYTEGAPMVPLGNSKRAIMDLLPYTTVLERSYATRDGSGNLLTGQPQAMAFQDLTGTNLFYPAADATYTVAFEFNRLFTTWSIGGGGTESFLLPDDYMLQLLRYGAPSKLQYNEPGNDYCVNAAKKWEEFIASMTSKGDLGEQAAQRMPANRDEGFGMEYFGGSP